MDPTLTRMVPLTVEMYPPTDMVDVFGRLFDQVQRHEERMQRLHDENSRLRSRVELVAGWISWQ